MTEVPLDRVPGALEAVFAASGAADASREREAANVELLGRMVQAIAAGRFHELRAHMAEDVTYEIAVPAAIPWQRRASGADEVTAAIAANFGAVTDQRTEPLAIVAQGETVMLMARETGRMAETGVPYQALLAQQFTFRDGKLALFRSVTQIE